MKRKGSPGKKLNIVLARDFIHNIGPCSRNDLARYLGVTPPTASSIAENLLQSGWLIEHPGKDSTGGRRPLVLEINPRVGFIFAVEIQENRLIAAVFDLAGTLFEKQVFEVNTFVPDEVVKTIVTSFVKLSESTGIPLSSFMACAVALPGFINARDGMVERSINLRWHRYPLRQRLTMCLGEHVLVCIENLSNAAVYAERKYGFGSGAVNMLYLNLDETIGAGIIINGDIYRGSSYAGEIGHVILQPENGYKCRCGLNGCFEAICTTREILEKVKANLRRDSENAEIKDLGLNIASLTFEQLTTSPLNGLPQVLEVFREAGLYAGIVICNMLSIFDFDTVVLGGKLTESGEMFMREVMRIIERRIFPELLERLRITRSELGANPALRGLCGLAEIEIFANSKNMSIGK